MDNCTGCDRQLTSKQWAIDKFEAFRDEFDLGGPNIVTPSLLENFISTNSDWYNEIFKTMF